MELFRHALVRNTLDVPIPEGWPSERGAVLAEVITSDRRGPAVLDALWSPGCGYSHHFDVVTTKPIRQLSDRAKQDIRRKALERRIQAAAPLFADELRQRELARTPAYFGINS